MSSIIYYLGQSWHSLSLCFKWLFLTIYSHATECLADVQGGGISVRAPNPRILSGTGGKLSSFFQKFNWNGSGIVGKPISTYYDDGNKLGFDSVNTYMSQRGTAHLSAQQTADNVVNFYYGFKQYMPETNGLMCIFRGIESGYCLIMYFLDILLEKMYVHLFGLMQLSKEGGPVHGTANMDSINGWWRIGQQLGLVICALMLVFYLISAILSSRASSFGRFKNEFWNIFIGTFFVFALPALTTFVADGAQSVAQGGLGNNKMVEDVFYHNVYSVPHKIIGMVGDKTKIPIGSTNSGAPLTYGPPGDDMITKREAKDGGTNPVPARTININLDKMRSAKELDSWNGLREQSIPSFLGTYASTDDVLDSSNLTSLYKTVNDSQKAQKATGNNDIILPTLFPSANAARNKKKPKATNNQTNTPNKKPNVKVSGMTKKQQQHIIKQQKKGQKQAEKDKKKDTTSGSNPNNTNSSLDPKAMANDLKYRISGSGTGASIRKVQAFKKFHVPFVSPAYAMYKMNVFNVDIFLLLLACIFIAFSWKIIGAFWKAMVMYTMSGVMIAHSVNNTNKIKQYINAYFSLFEMLMLDVVFVRLFFIGYQMINNSLMPDIISYTETYGGMMTRDIASQGVIIVDLIKAILDFGLFLACLDGVKVIDQDLGADGATGAHQSWMRDLMMFRAAKGAISKVGSAATGAFGMKGAGGAFGSRNANKLFGNKGSKALAGAGAMKNKHSKHKNGMKRKPHGGLNNSANGLGNLAKKNPDAKFGTDDHKNNSSDKDKAINSKQKNNSSASDKNQNTSSSADNNSASNSANSTNASSNDSAESAGSENDSASSADEDNDSSAESNADNSADSANSSASSSNNAQRASSAQNHLASQTGSATRHATSSANKSAGSNSTHHRRQNAKNNKRNNSQSKSASFRPKQHKPNNKQNHKATKNNKPNSKRSSNNNSKANQHTAKHHNSGNQHRANGSSSLHSPIGGTGAKPNHNANPKYSGGFKSGNASLGKPGSGQEGSDPHKFQNALQDYLNGRSNGFTPADVGNDSSSSSDNSSTTPSDSDNSSDDDNDDSDITPSDSSDNSDDSDNTPSDSTDNSNDNSDDISSNDSSDDSNNAENDDDTTTYQPRDLDKQPHYTQDNTNANSDVAQDKSDGQLVNDKSGDTKGDPKVDGNNIKDSATKRGIKDANEAGTSNPNTTQYVPTNKDSDKDYIHKPDFDNKNLSPTSSSSSSANLSPASHIPNSSNAMAMKPASSHSSSSGYHNAKPDFKALVNHSKPNHKRDVKLPNSAKAGRYARAQEAKGQLKHHANGGNNTHRLTKSGQKQQHHNNISRQHKAMMNGNSNTVPAGSKDLSKHNDANGNQSRKQLAPNATNVAGTNNGLNQQQKSHLQNTTHANGNHSAKKGINNGKDNYTSTSQNGYSSQNPLNQNDADTSDNNSDNGGSDVTPSTDNSSIISDDNNANDNNAYNSNNGTDNKNVDLSKTNAANNATTGSVNNDNGSEQHLNGSSDTTPVINNNDNSEPSPTNNDSDLTDSNDNNGNATEDNPLNVNEADNTPDNDTDNNASSDTTPTDNTVDEASDSTPEDNTSDSPVNANNNEAGAEDIPSTNDNSINVDDNGNTTRNSDNTSTNNDDLAQHNSTNDHPTGALHGGTTISSNNNGGSNPQPNNSNNFVDDSNNGADTGNSNNGTITSDNNNGGSTITGTDKSSNTGDKSFVNDGNSNNNDSANNIPNDANNNVHRQHRGLSNPFHVAHHSNNNSSNSSYHMPKHNFVNNDVHSGPRVNPFAEDRNDANNDNNGDYGISSNSDVPDFRKFANNGTSNYVPHANTTRHSNFDPHKFSGINKRHEEQQQEQARENAEARDTDNSNNNNSSSNHVDPGVQKLAHKINNISKNQNNNARKSETRYQKQQLEKHLKNNSKNNKHNNKGNIFNDKNHKH